MREEANHKQLLEILGKFDALCAEHGISYSLHGGTLLGAVREKGFIPWDDDADVSMTRQEFEKLETVLSGSGSACFIRGKIKKQFCQTGDNRVWVDIFICDRISEREVPQKLKLLLLTLLDVMHRDRQSMKLSNLDQYSKVKQLVFKAAFALGQLLPKSWTEKGYVYVSRKCFLGRGELLFRSNDQYQGRGRVFPAEWMEAYGKVPFEDRQLSVMRDWDAMLIQCYGPDYMVPLCQDRNAAVHDLVRASDSFAL